MTTTPPPPNLAFCRTLVDEWVRAGITNAVVAPGSRSAPLAVAVAERLDCQVILDERSASFTALGLALATQRPTVLVCTSGTAAAQFHAAVIEASQACVPLIVCTADRPPELQDVGAPQTIDQVAIFGTAPRWTANPGPPDPTTLDTWRPLASRAVIEATRSDAGPVHLNLAFREPLLHDTSDNVAGGRADDTTWHRIGDSSKSAPSRDLARLCSSARRPVVLTGQLALTTSAFEKVPVFGDHRGRLCGTIPHWDLLVGNETFADAHEPDLVIRIGLPPASKASNRWVAQLAAPQVALLPPGRWIDPHGTCAMFADLSVELDLTAQQGWFTSWAQAGAKAARAIDEVLYAHPEVTEPGVARHTFATRRPGSAMVVSSSMPVRDLETFAHPRSDVTVFANRGANGIDGVTSTALGVAASGVPTTLLIGDLALLHDVGALTGITERGVDLTVVVIDNAGGGIFSFLAQHDLLDHRRFEQLFGTPQHVDLPALFALHHIPVTVVETAAGLTDAFEHDNTQHGVRAIIARTNREANLELHHEFAAAVAAALA